jgi:hypothetical protein
MIIVESAKAQGSKVKPNSQVRDAQSNQSEGRSDSKVASNWRIWSPIEGTCHPQASYLISDHEISFTHLHVGWH